MNYDEKHMHEALAEARLALDGGEFPVGCIIACGDNIVTKGHRTNSQGSSSNEMDHAEISALRLLLTNHQDIVPGDVTVYATMEPCLMCYTTLLLNGVRRIVYAYEDAMGGGTSLNLSELNPLYQQMKVEIIPHICRTESLDLFREFFSNPDNDYWQDSLLADNTLQQS